ncbi:unnamed protein product [Albugo candida]|uniref:Uncharacterized protein n=1 Tax=Albugo candida TaxID=65357 RepID=A0A024FW63_9STRA|nr:unnamed protein product [Albugo candida]|eukprot:CCI11276.1 unnamed protein product [Albugo candida]
MKAIVCKTFGLAVLGAFQEYQHFVGAYYVKLITVPSHRDVPSDVPLDVPPQEIIEKGLKVDIDPPLKFLPNGDWEKPHDRSLIYAVTLSVVKPIKPDWIKCTALQRRVLETWISRKTIHISRKAYGLNLKVYLSYNAGALSFRMSHIQGLHIRFVDPIAPSPIIKTFSVTAGILWMELFGDVIKCEFSFDPNQAFTSVPNEIYHKLVVLMHTLGYPKEGDGVYKGKCDDVNRVFDKYLNHYPGYDKIGIFIRKKKQDPYSLPYDTFIVETDGHCHINLRNGADKCILEL